MTTRTRHLVSERDEGLQTYRFGFVIEQTLGHATYQRNLARWAADDPSVDPTWISLPYWDDDRWARWPIIRGNLSLSLSLRARDRLREEWVRPAYDALFFHTQATALFCIGHARRLPIVVSLDGTPMNLDSMASGYGGNADTPGAFGRWKSRWYRRLFLRAAALTTWNRWARDSLVRDYRIPEEKIAVIPPGVDLDAWSMVPGREAAGVPLRILFVGGDFVRKGGRVLMEAFRGGLRGRCELDIVTGEESPEAVGGEGVRVHRGLPPNSAELHRRFAEADLFVLPTLADCMPLAITEAMASGLAVVATDVGAISEQVAGCETGLLIPPGDPSALARAVSSLVDDPGRRRAFGIAGRRRAERLFDGERNYRALADLLKHCVDGYAGPPTAAVARSRLV